MTNFILFPAVNENLKNKTATYSYDPDNFYLKAATTIKTHFPECCLISDVAMDPYSSDGHDGLVDPDSGEVLNDDTLEILAQMALVTQQPVDIFVENIFNFPTLAEAYRIGALAVIAQRSAANDESSLAAVV